MVEHKTSFGLAAYVVFSEMNSEGKIINCICTHSHLNLVSSSDNLLKRLYTWELGYIMISILS
jgi:hypothetical protein